MIDITKYIVIFSLVGCVIYLWITNRRLVNSNLRVLLTLETTLWRLASLSRLIIATGESDLIDLADQILTAEKKEENKDEIIRKD